MNGHNGWLPDQTPFEPNRPLYSQFQSQAQTQSHPQSPSHPQSHSPSHSQPQALHHHPVQNHHFLQPQQQQQQQYHHTLLNHPQNHHQSVSSAQFRNPSIQNVSPSLAFNTVPQQAHQSYPHSIPPEQARSLSISSHGSPSFVPQTVQPRLTHQPHQQLSHPSSQSSVGQVADINHLLNHRPFPQASHPIHVQHRQQTFADPTLHDAIPPASHSQNVSGDPVQQQQQQQQRQQQPSPHFSNPTQSHLSHASGTNHFHLSQYRTSMATAQSIPHSTLVPSPRATNPTPIHMSATSRYDLDLSNPSSSEAVLAPTPQTAFQSSPSSRHQPHASAHSHSIQSQQAAASTLSQAFGVQAHLNPMRSTLASFSNCSQQPQLHGQTVAGLERGGVPSNPSSLSQSTSFIENGTGLQQSLYRPSNSNNGNHSEGIRSATSSSPLSFQSNIQRQNRPFSFPSSSAPSSSLSAAWNIAPKQTQNFDKILLPASQNARQITNLMSAPAVVQTIPTDTPTQPSSEIISNVLHPTPQSRIWQSPSLSNPQPPYRPSPSPYPQAAASQAVEHTTPSSVNGARSVPVAMPALESHSAHDPRNQSITTPSSGIVSEIASGIAPFTSQVASAPLSTSKSEKKSRSKKKSKLHLDASFTQKSENTTPWQDPINSLPSPVTVHHNTAQQPPPTQPTDGLSLQQSQSAPPSSESQQRSASAAQTMAVGLNTFLGGPPSFLPSSESWGPSGQVNKKQKSIPQTAPAFVSPGQLLMSSNAANSWSTLSYLSSIGLSINQSDLQSDQDTFQRPTTPVQSTTTQAILANGRITPSNGQGFSSPDPLDLLSAPQSAPLKPYSLYIDPAALASSATNMSHDLTENVTPLKRKKKKKKRKRQDDLEGEQQSPAANGIHADREESLTKKKKKQKASQLDRIPTLQPELDSFHGSTQRPPIEVVVPVSPDSLRSLPTFMRTKYSFSPQKARQTTPMEVSVEIPASQTTPSSSTKQASNRVRAFEIIQGSDSEMDAEGSDWEDLEFLDTWGTPMTNNSDPMFSAPRGAGRLSNGPVKSSSRKVPLAKLCGLMEDLFEADDMLPDRDTLSEMSPGQSFSGAADQFFELIESPARSSSASSIVVLRSAVLQKLLKLILKCSKPFGELAATGDSMALSKPMDLASIPQHDLARMFSILERTVKMSEGVDPFSSLTKKEDQNQAGGGPAKRKKKNTAAVRSSRSPSKSTLPEDDMEDLATPPASPKEDEPTFDITNTDEALESLSGKFSALDRSILAAGCFFATLTGDLLPKPLMSEGLIRSGFDAVKVALDKVILPFIEGCSGATYTSMHPLLSVLISVLAPQKARKKKVAVQQDTAGGLAVICRNHLSDLFGHLCSTLFFVQKLVKMPNMALSDVIIISGVYFALGPFFVVEPEQGGGAGSSEAAKASVRGRAAFSSLGGTNAMKTLRAPALNLLRNIFARHPDQRQWVIEEILTSLTKLADMKKNRRQYTLRNGKSIHSVNALLLQLIQASAHGVRQHARAVADGVSKVSSDRKASRDTESDEEGSAHHSGGLSVVIPSTRFDEDEDENKNAAEMSVWRRGLEGANHSARSVVLYLMQRVGQTKVSKASQEMSHALIIDNLVQDLLCTLYLPEWPAAALLLSCFCRVFGNCLEDPKGNLDAKGVALDHLGPIAARLRQSQLTIRTSAESKKADGQEEQPRQQEALDPEEDGTSTREPLPPQQPQAWERFSIPRAIQSYDMAAIKDMLKSYRKVIRYLTRSGSDDQATEGSVEFLFTQAQGELAAANAKMSDQLDAAIANDADSVELFKVHEFKEALEGCIQKFGCWNPHEADLGPKADTLDDDGFRRAFELSERLVIASDSMISFDFIRLQLIDALNGQSVGNRSKALRGLGCIAEVDPDLLDEAPVRSAIEVRLRDSSTTVREVAVGLLGKYILRKPQHIEQYYLQLAGRALDAGLAVRKRVVRLLKSIHFASKSPNVRIDCCVRLVRCVNDEDTSVQDLAVFTLGEMWLSLDITAGLDGRRIKRRDSPTNDVGDQAVVAEFQDDQDYVTRVDSEEIKKSDTINTIMAVAGIIRERPSPLEEVFRKLFKDRRESEAKELLAKLQLLGDSLIDGLVESSEESSVETVKRIRTVQLFASTNPAILTISKAKLLLPYLKSAQTAEELQIMELLLKIFRSCLPWMPKTALAFAESLEKSLTPLISRPPPKASMQTLQELIACFCTVITSHTHNFKILARTLKACFVRLQQIKNGAASGKKIEENKSWSLIMSLTALLCENADFDDIRTKQPEVADDINSISPRPIVDAVSETLLFLHKTGSELVRSMSLQNLGYLFRAYPTLMTRSSMTAMMDDIFSKGSLQDRTTLLRILLDFLTADAAKRNPDALVAPLATKKKKEEMEASSSVDMTVLVGNTESFADTGVGSAIMQRYSEPVLKATLEVGEPALQRTAIDILKFTVLQGLSHPIQCVPYLVSLETTEEASARAKALHLHSHLASKHASLVQARFLDSARAAFKFQLGLGTAETVCGYRMEGAIPTAMLNAWYGLLRDRRHTRLDFLRQIVKALDVNTAAADCSLEEVLFARFMADNLATLDYKTLEELFVVIGDLRSILAVSGMQVLFMIQSHLKSLAPAGSGDSAVKVEEGTVPNGDGNSISQQQSNPWLNGESQTQHTMETMISDSGWQPSGTGSGEATSSNASNPPCISPIPLARMSIIAGTALLLRNHLKHLYNLSEIRCAKFNPAKKQSAGADRPAVQRHLHDPIQAALSVESMPFGLKQLETEGDATQQMEAYARMVENEGTMLEPEDPEMMDDL